MSERHANAEGLAKAVASIAAITGDSINARLTKAGLPAMEDREAAALALVRASGIKSQGEATVLIVNLTGGTCNAEQVTAALKAGFPGAKIGARHGPHYLSLARTGKLEGVEATGIPHSARKAKKAAPIVVALGATTPPAAESTPAEPVVETAPAVPDTSALKAELEALSQKDLAARAKAAGVKAIGKKEDIVARILAAS